MTILQDNDHNNEINVNIVQNGRYFKNIYFKLLFYTMFHDAQLKKMRVLFRNYLYTDNIVMLTTQPAFEI